LTFVTAANIARYGQYLPPFPSVRGPSAEYSIAYVQSADGIFKIFEMVRMAKLG